MHSVGKSVIIKKEGKNMDINVRKIKLGKYGKGLELSLQSLSLLKKDGALEVTR